MKRIFLVLPVFMILLAACGAPTAAATPVPTETEVVVVSTNTESAPVPTDAPTEAVPSAKLPAASFDAQTYIDEKFGFAFEYPSGWTVTEPTGGERGTQVQFLSSPDIANAATLPEGATRLSATVYNWDPKNDLTAYVAHRKTAWDASGFTILEEQSRTLELGLPAVQFTIQTSEATSVFLFAPIGDRYLELSGEGDLDLVKEMVQRVRPVTVK